MRPSRTPSLRFASRSILLALLALPAAAAIDSTTLAVLINEDDPDSRVVGEYYAAARHIPARHVLRVRLPMRSTLTQDEFRALELELARKLPASIEAIAATWLEPHRVECMSMTSALAFGFDQRFCGQGCALTRPSPLYASETSAPHADFGVRPAMLVAAGSVAATKALIDRGIAAHVADREVQAYLVTSGDPARDIRAYAFRELEAAPPARVHVVPRQGFSPIGAGALFYFTGAVRVPGIEQFALAPGAIADHVTSAGAVFDQTGQMTVLEWLRAGAAGSYGTVVEPCNFPAKFPDPDIVIRRYAAGAPLIEAYWKSVRMPGQGLFVGEPLARPFGD